MIRADLTLVAPADIPGTDSFLVGAAKGFLLTFPGTQNALCLGTGIKPPERVGNEWYVHLWAEFEAEGCSGCFSERVASFFMDHREISMRIYQSMQILPAEGLHSD